MILGHDDSTINIVMAIIIIIIIIWRAFGAAGIPAVKEPSGLDRQGGKRPERLTLIRSLVWDVTVVSPLAALLTEQPQTPVIQHFYVVLHCYILLSG